MVINNKIKLIVVLGPNASGKSDLAVTLAKKYNGEIISADSRQVYKGMDIGTGKVPQDKKTKHRTQNPNKTQIPNIYYHKNIPHYLLDVANPKRRFSVAQYKHLAQKAIKNIRQQSKVPIICGGTGFYIQAITDNLKIPEVKPDFKLRAKLEKKSVGELFSDLKLLDPERAKTIDRHNPRRLIRALEIVIKTGRPVPPLIIPAKARPNDTVGQAGIQASGNQNLDSGSKAGMTNNNFEILFLGVKKSPQKLKKLIYKRLRKRLRQGMIKEVENLRQSGVSWKRLEDFGLEYRWIAKYIKALKSLPFRSQKARNLPRMRVKIPDKLGDSSLTLRMTKKRLYSEMFSRLQKEIEHYAKRQMVWFKRDKRINWIKNKNQTEKLVKNFMK